jgi:hypothetical protein
MRKENIPIDAILSKTVNRLNTTISITVAGYAADYLADRMPSALTVMVGTVVFCTIFALSRMHPSLKENQILVSLRSIIGITVTTTMMQLISKAGTAQVMDPLRRSTTGRGGGLGGGGLGGNTLLLSSSSIQNLHPYNIPSLLLGTVFVIGSGAIPLSIRQTEEGGAIYMGIQFAYSDIIVSNIKDKTVQQNLMLIFLLLSPWIEVTWESMKQHNSIIQAWKESLMFAGLFFVILDFDFVWVCVYVYV